MSEREHKKNIDKLKKENNRNQKSKSPAKVVKCATPTKNVFETIYTLDESKYIYSK